MKYSKEIIIDLPREEVVKLFDSEENMYKWMEGLQSTEQLEGTPGQVGAKMKLSFKMGKREIDMVETITHRNLPEEFFGTYEAKACGMRLEIILKMKVIKPVGYWRQNSSQTPLC